MSQKAKKCKKNSALKKVSIDFYFWAKKTLDQDPESGSALR